ncbi:tetratricopeptide repeat protein [Kribbella sp. NPDC002412]
MPVPEAQIELPDIDVLDTPFKKAIACSAALLVLLGSLLALAASRAGEHERNLSAHAQETSITSLAQYGAAYVEISKLAAGDGEVRSLRQRAELARFASSLTGTDTYTTAAQLWDKSSLALADLAVQETGSTHFEDVNRQASDRLLEPRVTALRADAERETATAWGTKSDRYVLGITLLAVALSLLGLSLTLAPGTRNLVVVPALVIAGFAVLVSVIAASQRPLVTPDAAVVALAEGDKRMWLRQYDGAVESYTEAIRLRSDYTQAYRARATATVLAGSPENAAYVFTTVDEKSRLRSIADLDRALELSPVPDYLSLVNQGANLFHVRRYAASEVLTRRALESNDRLPLPWANLGLVQAAQGEEAEARASYGEMVRRTAERPDPLEQAELYASSRTTLEILAVKEPDRKDLVQKLQGMLVAAQAELSSPGPNPAGADATISALKLTATGWYVGATYQRAKLPEKARISWIGYFRPSPGEPWQQRSTLAGFDRIAAGQPAQRYFVDSGCPGRGEYRLDAWLDDRLLASATVASTPNGTTSFVGSYDSSGRISACRPPGWDLDDSVPGRIRLSAPGTALERLTVRAAPLPAELIGQAVPQVISTALDTEPRCTSVGKPTAQAPFALGGVNGVFRQYKQQNGDRAVWCWAGVGADNSVRTVVAQYEDKATSRGLIGDLLTRLYFDVRRP